MATDYLLPIEKFLIDKVKEHFPDFDTREGTAFRDMVIKPMIVFLQPFRDQVNVLKRNMSLQNFEQMTEEEMDALVANIFVTRKGGVKSEGTVRVYMLAAQQTSFSTDVQFQTATGLIFNPEETISFTAEEIALNIDGLYYYADVPSVAQEEGVEYNIDAHSIVFISGGPPGIVKVDNLSAFALGIDNEDNATLKYRSENAIVTRDLVTKRSISATLLAEYNTLREVAVIGFGDDEMQRDILTAIMDLLVVVEQRYFGSVTGDGTVFSDVDPGDPIDFVDIGIKPGHEIVILSGADAGKHTIKSVTSATTLELYDTLTLRSNIEYGIDGLAIVDDYHIGGKVDIYADTTSLEEKTFFIDVAQEINNLAEGSPVGVTLPVVGIASMIAVDPITHDPLSPSATYTLWPEHTRITSDKGTGEITAGTTFQDNDTADPVDFITLGVQPGYKLVIVDGLEAGTYTIESVDTATQLTLTLVETLTVRPNVNYRIEVSDYRLETSDADTRLSVNEEVRIRLLQTDVAGDRYFIGETLKVNYYADTSISEYQQYVTNELNRVVTADLLVRRCLPAFVDIDITYRGDLSEENFVAVVEEFIDKMKIGATFEASDLVATLYFFDVDYIENDFLIRCDKYGLDGTLTHEESEVSVSIDRTSKFVARNITATKLV